MHIKTIEDERIRSFRSHKRKKLLASLILAFVGVAGLASWAIVQAVSSQGDTGTISRDNSYGANDGDLLYGVDTNRGSDFIWSTHWYKITVNGVSHDAVCIQPSKGSPSGTAGVTEYSNNNMKRALLATIASYSNSQSGSPVNYYNAFGNSYSWNTSGIINLLRNDQGHSSTAYSNYYGGGHPTTKELRYILGHIMSGLAYSSTSGQHYGLDSGGIARAQQIQADINSWFSSNNYNSVLDDFKLFTAWDGDSDHQRVAWLEYDNPTISTNIKIRKVDSGTKTVRNDNCSIDGANHYCTVEGSVFSVLNSSGTEVTTITINSSGVGTTAAPITTAGTYTIKEKTASTGYVKNNAAITVVISRTDDGKTIDLSGSTSTICNGQTFPGSATSCRFENTIIKGNVSFRKVQSALQPNADSTATTTTTSPLAGVAFNIYKNHDRTTPVNSQPITTNSDGIFSYNNLPYGKYYVVEQPGANNNAFTMIEFGFEINTNNTTVNLGDKANVVPDNPAISTVARNSKSPVLSPDKELEVAVDASITDRVTSCSGLSPNHQYKLVGKLYTMEHAEVPTSGATEFTSNATGGCDPFDMVFAPAFDTSQYLDKYLGIKQFIYKKNGNDWILVGIHNKDLSDNDEKVKVKNIEITTNAISERSQDNKVLAAGEVKVIDSYNIEGLTEGQAYTLKGYVKYDSTNIATATNNISMAQGAGTSYSGTMTFELDSTPYVGKDLTVVQELYISGRDTPIVTHSTNDGSETVHVITPTVDTHAVNNRNQSSQEIEVGHINESGSPTIKDTVTYSGLASGTIYTAYGQIRKLESDGTVAQDPITTKSKSFTASSENGSIDLTFELDTIENCSSDNRLNLPCKFVVFEYLYHGELGTNPFAYHVDTQDANQIVSVGEPKITTAASDIQNDTKYLPVGTTTVLDKVTYTNLMPGQAFILEGKLVDKETGNIVKNSANEDITAREPFTTASDSATIHVDSFKTFDTVLHYDYTKGENQKKYVVHQTLKSGDVVLYTHADNTDENQTVQIGVPKMVTSATYKRDGSHLLGVGDVTMKDYVDYEGLVEGEWYMIVGTMVDPETGTPVEINDEFVRNSKTFKAGADGKGTVELEINLNTVSIQGRKFVVHERLYRSEDKHGDGRILAVHEPALDEDDQTITVKKASIGTVASDKADGDNVLSHEENQTVVDKVHYDGLLMDEQYTLYGYLYDKTNDEPLKDANGNLITATATFTTPAREDNGDVEMEFPVNATDLPGVEIVVFEYLFQGETVPTKEDGTVDLDQKVTEHADKEDPGQTVKVSMRIGTTAADSYDGDQIIGVGKVLVIDNLQYEGASAGKTYKAKGWLVYKADSDEHHAGDKVSSPVITCIIDDETDYDEGDDEDDEEYDGDGDDEEGEEESEEEDEEESTRTCTRDWAEVEAEETFTIGSEDHEDTSGVATIEFEFDSRELIGQKLVVFEELYLIDDEGREELVAEHKNLEDSSQTITVATPTIHTIASDKADGDKELANDAEATIVDKVEYTGLVADTTYTLHGVLVDKNSGERVSGGLTEITWTFTPTRDAGVEELEFTINTTGLSGKEIVAFETLYIDDVVDEENWIAEHKDLNDDSQTVWVKVNKPNTGLFAHSMEEARLVNLYTTIGGLAVASISIWFAYRYAKHRKIRQF